MKRSSIQNKPKKCRGQNKAIAFKGCGKINKVRKYGLGMECGCYYEWLRTSPEGLEMIKQATAPLQKKRDDFKAAERDYEERKSLPYLLGAAQNAVNAYIRERDKGLNCISCDAPWKPDFQAGHCYSLNKFPRMRFDEDNENGQCCGCNLMKEGNHEMYRIGIEKRFGSEKLAEIDEKARLDKLQGVHKWDRSELIRIRKYFTGKINDLKNLKNQQ